MALDEIIHNSQRFKEFEHPIETEFSFSLLCGRYCHRKEKFAKVKIHRDKKANVDA